MIREKVLRIIVSKEFSISLQFSILSLIDIVVYFSDDTITDIIIYIWI